jgi:hypothetical protein
MNSHFVMEGILEVLFDFLLRVFRRFFLKIKKDPAASPIPAAKPSNSIPTLSMHLHSSRDHAVFEISSLPLPAILPIFNGIPLCLFLIK